MITRFELAAQISRGCILEGGPRCHATSLSLEGFGTFRYFVPGERAGLNRFRLDGAMHVATAMLGSVTKLESERHKPVGVMSLHLWGCATMAHTAGESTLKIAYAANQ